MGKIPAPRDGDRAFRKQGTRSRKKSACWSSSPRLRVSPRAWSREEQGSIESILDQMFENSDPLTAQEFTPTDFDWRIGISTESRSMPLPNTTWRRTTADGTTGNPRTRMTCAATSTAFRSRTFPRNRAHEGSRVASMIGNGLPMADLKEVHGKPMVIEVNEQPEHRQRHRRPGGRRSHLPRHRALAFRRRIEERLNTAQQQKFQQQLPRILLPMISSKAPWHLWDRCGVELEYMIIGQRP